MKNGIRIRLALESERETLEALQWRAALENPGDRDVLLAHPDAISLPLEHIAAGEIFVAERDDGDLVGFAVIQPRADGQIELDGLFVDPPFWKGGIGRDLIEYCSLIARERKAHFLHVVGNPHAQGFYEACGFEYVGKEETRFGMGLLLRKSLLF